MSSAPTVLSPAWSMSPGLPNFYVNAVAASSNASRILAGTFYHAYSSQSRHDPRLASKEDASDPQTGTFGCYCFDESGNELWSDEFQAWQGVYTVALSADGAFAASGGWFSSSPFSGFVRAYNAATGQMLLNHPTRRRVNQVALSENGVWLLAAAESLTLFKYSGLSYTASDSYTLSCPEDQIVSAALSSDGATAVCTTLNGKVILFINSSGNLVASQSWQMPAGYSHCVSLSPSGSSFAVGGSAGLVHIFDSPDFIRTGQPALSLRVASAGNVFGIALSVDGKSFITLTNQGDAGEVNAYSRTGGNVAPRWKSPLRTDRNPNNVSVSEAVGLLGIADGHPDETPGNFYLADLATGELLGKFTTSNMNWPVTLSADGSCLIGGSDDSNVYCFRTALWANA